VIRFYNNLQQRGTAKLRASRTRLHELWVGLWVGKIAASPSLITAARSMPSPRLARFDRQDRSSTRAWSRRPIASVAHTRPPHPSGILALHSSLVGFAMISRVRTGRFAGRRDVSDPRIVVPAGQRFAAMSCRSVIVNRSQELVPTPRARATSGSGNAQGFARLRKTPADRPVKSARVTKRCEAHLGRHQTLRRTLPGFRQKEPSMVPGRVEPQTVSTDTLLPATIESRPPRRLWLFFSSSESIRDNCGDLLRKQNHRKYDYDRRPKTHVANHPAPNRALLRPSLLPES